MPFANLNWIEEYSSIFKILRNNFFSAQSYKYLFFISSLSVWCLQHNSCCQWRLKALWPVHSFLIQVMHAKRCLFFANHKPLVVFASIHTTSTTRKFGIWCTNVWMALVGWDKITLIEGFIIFFVRIIGHADTYIQVWWRCVIYNNKKWAVTYRYSRYGRTHIGNWQAK